MGDDVDLLPADKHESCFKLIVLLCVCEARHAPSTENNKFAMSFEYLKKSLKNEFDFLPADKHQRLLQMNTIILGVCDQP